MIAKQEMLAELETRRSGFTLPRKFYSDADYYRLDLESIHYREWLFAGHDCEISEPGRYFTLQVGEYPVLVVRAHDGSVRAFHNAPPSAARRSGSSAPINNGPTISAARCCAHATWTLASTRRNTA